MYRIHGFLLILTVLCLLGTGIAMADGIIFPVGLATPTDADITEQQAYMIAEEALRVPACDEECVSCWFVGGVMEILDGRSHFVALRENDSNTTAWVVTFCVYRRPLMMCVFTIDSRTGKVLNTSKGSPWVFMRNLEKTKGIAGYWSVEDQALFDLLYEDPEMPSRDAFPNDDDLPQTEALEIAIKAVKKELGVTGEFLQQFQISYGFKVSAEDSAGKEEREWLVSFASPSVAGGFEEQLWYVVYISSPDGNVTAILPGQDDTER